ncbi:MAG: tetratricopeptide repeat protein, partial [Methylacidiphilales bacterium]|nr:tetratricopeptide repeat protein [Candidatus Methylacidiphilales bacterium]
NDSLSADSLAVIVEGLWELKTISDWAVEKGEAAPALSPSTTTLFLKLSTAYNNPAIHQKIGEVYLKELGLPDIARKHFERALFLGGPENSLKPMVEAAARAAGPALRQFNKAAKIKMDGTKDSLKRIEEMLAKGKLAPAEALLMQANRNPAKPSRMGFVWAQLGLAYYQIEDYPKMEEAYLWALRYDNNDFVYAFNLGQAQQSQEKFDLAEASYLRADQLKPNNAKVWCNLGSLYFKTGRFSEAETGLKKAIKANPRYARAWDNLAAVYASQNKLEEALVAVQTAIKLQPDYPEAYFKLGSILFGKNSFQESKKAFQHCLDVPGLVDVAKAYLLIIDSKLS